MRTVLLFLVIFLQTDLNGQERIFTNNKGRTVKGSLEAVRNNNAVLNVDGKRFLVPVADLSVKDHAYIKQWLNDNFQYSLSFSAKLVENTDARSKGENLGGQSDGGIISFGMLAKGTASRSAWKYVVQIENRSGIDVTDLVLKYHIYNRISGRMGFDRRDSESFQTRDGAVRIPLIQTSRKESFSTIEVPTFDKKWTYEQMTYNSDGSSNRSRFKGTSAGKVDGIWVRAFKDGRLVGEYKSSGRWVKRKVNFDPIPDPPLSRKSILANRINKILEDRKANRPGTRLPPTRPLILPNSQDDLEKKARLKHAGVIFGNSVPFASLVSTEGEQIECIVHGLDEGFCYVRNKEFQKSKIPLSSLAPASVKQLLSLPPDTRKVYPISCSVSMDVEMKDGQYNHKMRWHLKNSGSEDIKQLGTVMSCGFQYETGKKLRTYRRREFEIPAGKSITVEGMEKRSEEKFKFSSSKLGLYLKGREVFSFLENY